MGISVNQIFEQLAATPGKKDKLAILERHKNNFLFKEVCRLALDPFIQFYIRKIPDFKFATGIAPRVGLEEALHRLEPLSSRKVTGNAAIEHLRTLLSESYDDVSKVIQRIIQKDLRCGVDTAVNKVWPNLVHEGTCMLVSPYSDKLVKKMVWPAYAQLKCDGSRFNAVVVDDEAHFYSRSGKEFFISDTSFYDQFVQLANGENLVFDGEILVRDEFGNELPRKEANGILNKAVKGTQTLEDGQAVFAVLWDIIPYKDWLNKRCTTPYRKRLTDLADRCMDQPPVGRDRVYLIDTIQVNNLAEATEWFRDFIEKGKEGLVLKNQDTIWENKRSKTQIKFKASLDCDLEIIEWQEGTGKYKGMLGSLVCRSSDGVVVTGVGTGFDDDDRAMIGPDIVGCIVAVKYNARIDKRDSNIDSLFLPVFLEIRNDKFVADHSKDIK